MDFSKLSSDAQLEIIKKEFAILVHQIFDDPNILSSFVRETRISKSQGRSIMRHINTLNAETCSCCRKFDQDKLKLPIKAELEPLIDIVQSSVKHKQY
jgi:hypothetical protein